MYLKLTESYGIFFLHLDTEGPQWGFKKITSVIPCYTNTVKYWIERYKHNQHLLNNFKGGLKPKISEPNKQKLIHLAANNKL